MKILDPKNFTDNKCSENNLEELSKLLVKYHKTATASNLKGELTDLMAKWDHFKISMQDIYNTDELTDSDSEIMRMP